MAAPHAPPTCRPALPLPQVHLGPFAPNLFDLSRETLGGRLVTSLAASLRRLVTRTSPCTSPKVRER